MLDSLPRLLDRRDIETVDCCLPYPGPARDRLVPILRNSGKEIVYAIHGFPLDKIRLGSVFDHEQGLARFVLEDQVAVAAEIGARGFNFASGIDPGPADRPAAMRALADLCRWLCPRLKSHGMIGLLEPFDREFDRRFLLGPTTECVALIESMRPENDNLYVQLDLAHIPLMGERFDEAVYACGRYIGHVHLGNCVMKDRADPFWGDKHPPIGYPGGEIDNAALAAALRCLRKSGYLNPQHRGSISIEAQPANGWTPEQTIEDQLRRLHDAWEVAQIAE
jgi:sugar phosphate isomerase/epimerase